MCGRYYMDDAAGREFCRLVREMGYGSGRIRENAMGSGNVPGKNRESAMDPGNVPGRNRESAAGPGSGLPGFGGSAADICPSQSAAVLTGRGPGLTLERMQWGFPLYKGGGLLINARAETVLEKKLFRDSVRRRRCVVPARHFYEWDRDKNKAMFFREDSPLICMAGFYDQFQGNDCFVIITVPACGPVSLVHDRMPLILEEQELSDWIRSDGFLEYALRREPPFLRRQQEYEQRSLFELLL